MLLILLALCLLRTGYNQTYPSSVLVPSNAITAVSFSCSATQIESWRLNGTVLTQVTIPTGISFASPGGLLTLTVAKESVFNFNGTSIQCRQAGENFSSVPTAFIIVYGHKPCLARYHVLWFSLIQVLPQSQVICHQSQYQMVYWCSVGLLHGLLMG